VRESNTTYARVRAFQKGASRRSNETKAVKTAPSVGRTLFAIWSFASGIRYQLADISMRNESDLASIEESLTSLFSRPVSGSPGVPKRRLAQLWDVPPLPPVKVRASSGRL
jgi:hypothetical protein